jgi:hypothetical protein
MAVKTITLLLEMLHNVQYPGRSGSVMVFRDWPTSTYRDASTREAGQHCCHPCPCLPRKIPEFCRKFPRGPASHVVMGTDYYKENSEVTISEFKGRHT